MSFHRNSEPMLHHYDIDETMLERVNEFRDLGVILDEEVTFNSHIARSQKLIVYSDFLRELTSVILRL